MSEEKRDYVKEAYECFIKNAEGLDPTDPVQAVAAYFERNATDELKARCKAEGKTAKGCWEFITDVARKVGGNCHIDPGAVQRKLRRSPSAASHPGWCGPFRGRGSGR